MTASQQIATQAESIVDSLTQTDYQHVANIHTANGIYDCDCTSLPALFWRPWRRCTTP